MGCLYQSVGDAVLRPADYGPPSQFVTIVALPANTLKLLTAQLANRITLSDNT